MKKQIYVSLKNSSKKIGEGFLKDPVRSIIEAALAEGREVLMEHESKVVLENFGFEVIHAYLASNADEAAKIAEKIGYPVVLKILSKEIIHKSDAGGVKLNLQDEKALRLAFQELELAFRSKGMIGVSVQKMAEPGIEAIIGIMEDKTFDKIIVFGLGGVFAEVIRDVTFRVAPISKEDAEAMIKEIKGYRILSGYRGLSADIEVLKNLLIKVSNFALSMPVIREMDLNPVFLYPWGYRIADARIILHKDFKKPFYERKKKNKYQRDVSYLRNLFYPQSVAVIGASNVKGKLGYNVVWNLINNGFKGKIYPINPNENEVQGIKAYPSIRDVPDSIDVAIVLVPAEITPKVIDECCASGVKYIIVESAGYSEKGEEGRVLECAIKEILEKYRFKTRLVGPNCAGIINVSSRFVGTFDPIDLGDKPLGGRIGLIAQAGVYAAGYFKHLKEVLDFKIIATIGNKLDVDEVDLLHTLGEDDDITVICLYLESVKRGKEFIEVAKKVTRRKPVIVLKTGRTEEGARAMLSHTASLAGNDSIYDAVFKQTGIIRAKDNEHMFALANAFSKQPLPTSNEIFIITYAGSFGVAAADALSLNNMKLASLPPDLLDELKKLMPKYTSGINPLDFTFSQRPEQVRRAIEIILQSENVGGLIVAIQTSAVRSYIDALTTIDFKGKPILLVVAAKDLVINDVINLEKSGIPVYSTPEQAVEVLATMYRYHLYRQALKSSS